MRRAPLRHRHVPVHGCRGVDAAPARARGGGVRGGARGASTEAARGVRRARRGRGGHAGRCVLRRLPDRAGSAGGGGGADGGARRRADQRPGRRPHGDAVRRRGGVRRCRRAPGGADRGGRAWRASARLRLDRDASWTGSRSATWASTASRISRRPSGSSSSASDEFPPLKTLFQTNLPVPATPFLGRERELGEVGELLARTRLLTLTGPGRRRQDAPRAAGGGRRRGRVPAGRLVGAARRCRRPRIHPRRGEPVARSAGRARHDHRRSAAPPRAGQLRAPDRRGARALRAARRLPEPRPARDESRATPDRG